MRERRRTSELVATEGGTRRPRDWRAAWAIARQTYAEWADDDAARLAAALAYYTMFSLAPLLVVAIGVAGFFLGQEAVRGQLVAQMAALVGRDGAQAIEDLIAHAGAGSDSVLASAVGVAALLFGASGVVGQLKGSLNRIWDVPAPAGGGVWYLVRERLLSMSMVLGLGFLLLVSLLISTALAAAGEYLQAGAGLWWVANAAVAFAVETTIFALLFKLLPDTTVRWADVWFGAACTAVLFSAGKVLIGLYLGRAGISSAFGAAGSLIVVLVWVYYSAQLLFLGAELTQVMARAADRRRPRRGHRNLLRAG